MDPLKLPDPETLALYKEIARHLLFAMVAGGLIGLERSFHGRPAGFRTHTLVCLASSLLMLVTLYQGVWFEQDSKGNVTMDPTRMAQGIMTGIGFLGAGVIFKEGLTVRGLTTAASIWMTASIGVLMGIGFYFPAVLATVLTLATLVLLHRVERVVPTHIYAQLTVRFDRLKAMPEADLDEAPIERRTAVMPYSDSTIVRTPRCAKKSIRSPATRSMARQSSASARNEGSSPTSRMISATRASIAPPPSRPSLRVTRSAAWIPFVPS